MCGSWKLDHWSLVPHIPNGPSFLTLAWCYHRKWQPHGLCFDSQRRRHWGCGWCTDGFHNYFNQPELSRDECQIRMGMSPWRFPLLLWWSPPSASGHGMDTVEPRLNSMQAQLETVCDWCVSLFAPSMPLKTSNSSPSVSAITKNSPEDLAHVTNLALAATNCLGDGELSLDFCHPNINPTAIHQVCALLKRMPLCVIQQPGWVGIWLIPVSTISLPFSNPPPLPKLHQTPSLWNTSLKRPLLNPRPPGWWWSL